MVFQCQRRSDGPIHWTFNEGRLAEEFHLTTEEIRDRPLDSLFPPEVVSRLLPELERAFGGEAREFTNELGGRFFKHNPQPVFDEEGKVVAVVGFITEVAGLVRAEETIRQLSDLSKKLNDDLTLRVLELAQSNRELETFSYTVSHDLRTPLTILENYAQVLLSRNQGPLDPESARYRIGMVSGTLVLWFSSSITASLVGLSRNEAWSLASRFISLTAALLILIAYRPPGPLRRRLEAASAAAAS